MNRVLSYLTIRIIEMIPILLIVFFILFSITKSIPADPVELHLGFNTEISEEYRESTSQLLGLDQAYLVQYFKWLSRTIQRDFGHSFIYRKPVNDIIDSSIKNSFTLNLTALILTFLIAFPLGIQSVTGKYPLSSKKLVNSSVITLHFLLFLLALLIVFIFILSNSSILESQSPSTTSFLDILRYFVFPLAVLVIPTSASLFIFINKTIQHILKQDYITTAKAKGLDDFFIVYKHALINTIFPLLGFIGYAIPFLFTGSIIIETIFNWPGIGKEFYNAIIAKDYNLLIVINVFFILMSCVGNLLIKIGNVFSNPYTELN